MSVLTLSEIDAGLSWFPPGSEIGPTDVDRFEFGTILQGRAEWTTGEQQLVLEPGVVHLSRPGSHRFVWDAERVTQHAWVEFQITSGQELLGPDREWPLVYPLLPRGPLGLLFGYVPWLLDNQAPPARRMADQALASVLQAWTSSLLPISEFVSVLPEAVVRAVDHVTSTWAREGMRPVSREELAAAAAISEGHLSRLFQESVGHGPIAAFERARLSRAASMLVRSNLRIELVARDVGFIDPHHFSRRFRAIYGTSPRAYRTLSGARPDPEMERGMFELLRRLWSEPPPITGAS